jgi:hypothetical protein
MTNAPDQTTSPGAPGRGTTGSATSGPGSGTGSTDQAKAEAHKVAESGKQGVRQVADEARSQTASLARTARGEARERIDGEVGRLAGFLSDIGDELNGMAEGADHRDGYLPALARDGSRAAGRLSDRLESGGIDGALQDVKMFARRRPGVFLAAAFGVGIALGRVTRNADLQSISDEIQHEEHNDADNAARGDAVRPSVEPSTMSTMSGPTTMAPPADLGTRT